MPVRAIGRRLRQPARADSRARRAGRATGARAAVRAPRHRPAARAGRAGARGRRLGERQRGDPRRRQQGGGRGAARARPPRVQRGLAGRPRAAVHRRARRSRWRARRRSTPVALQQRLRLCLRPRLADRRGGDGLADATSASRRTSVAPPRTPASAPRRAAARSSRPRARSPRCALGRLDERDDGQRRHDRRRQRDQRRARALRSRRRRCAASTTTAGEATVAEIVDRFHEAANLPECECDVDIAVQRTFSGYRPVAAALAQCAWPRRRCGLAGTSRCGSSSGGGSDANALLVDGLRRRSTWPTAPSATTSPASASASRRSRRCSTSRSRCSTRQPPAQPGAAR